MADVKQKISDFHESFRKEAEKVVKDVFPVKVLQMDELYKSEDFNLSQLSKVEESIVIPQGVHHGNDTIHHNDTEPTGKKRKISVDGYVDHTTDPRKMLIPCNKFIVKIISILKPEIQTLMEKCNLVKMWIQLNIPRIEDGNNFGVSIQEETLSEVQRIEGEAATFLDQISRYFITRGKIVSKVVKYPNLNDYRRTILELDEKEFISLRLCCVEIRNHYLCLHDSITKNLEKIKKPRSMNHDSLY